jgi:hypothetical protein
LPTHGGVFWRLGEDDLPHYKAGNAVKIIGKTGKSFIIPTNKPRELSDSINSLRAHAK